MYGFQSPLPPPLEILIVVILFSAEEEADAHPLVVIPVRVDDVQNRYDELIGFVVLAFRMEGVSAASMSFS